MKLHTLSLAVLTFALSPLAQALETKPFNQAEFSQAQTAGKSTALHFHADWCPTCKKQSASLEQLKADKALDITVFVANYDSEKALKQKYAVRTQSTLIVFKGDVEKTRLAGQTDASDIKTALIKGL